jgi:rRNA maturation protein Rpf1
MPFVTTSRQPVRKASCFARELAEKLGVEFKQRGKKTIQDLACLARKKGHSMVFIVTGNPEKLSVQVLQVTEKNWQWNPKTLKPDQIQLMKKIGGIKNG